MRILVCGGRDYQDYDKVRETLYSLFPPADENDPSTWLPPGDTVIIHGGAKGADTLADQWAVVNWLVPEVYEVTQEEWDEYGKAAGPIRNSRMLKYGKPDIVVAFPGGKGTMDMVNKAKAAGVKVIEVGA